MIRLINRLSNLGIDSSQDELEQRNILLINRLAVTSIGMLSVLIIVFSAIGKWINLPFFALMIVDCFGILWFNHKGLVRWSKLGLGVYVPLIVAMSVYTKAIGITASINFFIAPFIAIQFLTLLPVLVANFKDRWISLISVVPSLFCLVFFDKIHLWFGQDFYTYGFSDERFIFSFAGSFFFTAVVLLFMSERRVSRMFYSRVKELLLSEKESREELSLQNEQINAGINYASRIQRATLPDPDFVKALFPDSFVLYRPRDIVSGDFYWFGEKDGLLLAACVDCTGHGVPGAFMSMIGHSLLNEIIIQSGLTDPGAVLSGLHRRVRAALRQDETHNQDGMDISLICFDPKTRKLKFAGAKSPMLLFSDEKQQVVKGERVAVGGGRQADQFFEYPTHEFQSNEEIQLFLYSDGYQDQFGGPQDRKFMSKKFRSLLKISRKRTATAQKQVLEETLDDWMKQGNCPQTDDIMVIGIKF